jgi:hypothetical protein
MAGAHGDTLNGAARRFANISAFADLLAAARFSGVSRDGPALVIEFYCGRRIGLAADNAKA